MRCTSKWRRAKERRSEPGACPEHAASNVWPQATRVCQSSRRKELPASRAAGARLLRCRLAWPHSAGRRARAARAVPNLAATWAEVQREMLHALRQEKPACSRSS